LSRMSNSDPTPAELVARIEKLERRLAKLEKAMKPAKVIESVYYRDGKPLRGKPRKEVLSENHPA
jgi:hypothetical protein